MHHARHNHAPHTSASRLRSLCDSLIVLAVAIVLVRGFLVEGYLIATGSMAPHYYGEHQPIVCPACRLEFAVGTEFDDGHPAHRNAHAVCPNCLRDDIDAEAGAINRGDHLLVWKNAFVWRDPRRWEVVVFQNPNRPRETYLKRVAGLPGETVHIRDGNVFVDGRLVRKTLAEQRALAISVHDARFVPNDAPAAIARFEPRREDTRWRIAPGSWNYDDPHQTAGQFDWIDYRHTLRHGGTHTTTVAISEPLTPGQLAAFAPTEGEFPYSPALRFPGVTYAFAENALTCRGVLTAHTRHQLLAVDASPAWLEAVARLDAESHFAPVDDFVAYNSLSSRQGEYAVDELLLLVDFEHTPARGELALAARVDGREYVCRVDFAAGTLTLTEGADGPRLAEGTFSPSPADPCEVVLSTVDRQIGLALDGRWGFAPYPLDELRSASFVSRTPVSIGWRGGAAEIARVELSRDVFYTTGGKPNASDLPLRLDADEFFVLGDNSPVSWDSRGWPHPAVPRRLLVGKPFLVHLPSRLAEWNWGTGPVQVRVPDFSRMRFVR